jgi:CubicO group peptidase (beta-lactamase class C family)
MNAYRALSSIERWIIALFAPTILVGLHPAYGQNGAVGIAYPVAERITVDGDLGDWPKGLQPYTIGRVEYGDKLRGEDDLEAHFRLAYNPKERALYVAVEVRDDSVVVGGPGEISWNTQDGCELFIDAAHAGNGSPVIQYARYGDRDQLYGPVEGRDHKVKVAVARTANQIAYEWRIEFGTPLDPDRAIGFDISVPDKDKDGSFSWAAWGPGTQKLDMPDRCGEFLLVTPGTRFGEVSGLVAWKDPSNAALPARVRIQSTRTPQLWRTVPVDASGAYKAMTLPAGPYSVHPVDSTDLRVDATTGVHVQVEPDRPATAGLLCVAPIPWPGLIGSEGVLNRPGSVNSDDLDHFVRAYLDYFRIPGISVAVIKDFKVVYHRGFGLKNTMTREPINDDTVFEAASMTKPVFAYTVLRLVDRQLLDLDTPLYNYLPYDDIAYDDRYKLITARMVLTHRTGFPNWRSGKLDIKFTPGTQVSYSGEGFVYLGKVVERLTGKKLVDLCREEVFAPLGIENASLVWNEDMARKSATGHSGQSPLGKGKPSQPNVAASLHVNAQNYARFLIAVLRGRGLSGPTAREMLRPQVKILGDTSDNGWWGLGIAIEETPFGRNYGHGGRNPGFTSHSMLYKDRGVGYVFLVNNDDASKVENVLNAYLIAGKSALKKIEPVSHKAVKVDPKLYDAFAGRYELGPGIVVTFTREGDHFMAQPPGEGKSEIFPESETVFFLDRSKDATWTFVKDQKGEITHVVFRRDGHDTKAKRLAVEPKFKAAR